MDEDLPINLYLLNDSYSLIGFTCYSKDHFFLKIFNGHSFEVIDNLKGSKQYFNYEITNIFYEIN